MINEIKLDVEQRGITRLCHFTPSRNLCHILTGGIGILSTRNLQEHERALFTQTDLIRLDNHEGYICCSIEYPNVWYFDKAKLKDNIFKDWVVLFIDPKYIWKSGTLFCPRNAASNSGRNIVKGEQGFKSLFDNKITSNQGIRSRSPSHLPCCPTDNQAEVLIPDQISISDILSIAVPSKEQAVNEIVRLQLQGIREDNYKFVVAPHLFEKYELRDLIFSGKRPDETVLKVE